MKKFLLLFTMLVSVILSVSSITFGEEIEESEIADTEEIVTTYYMDAAELKHYEKTKEYDKGKKNPFAPVSTGTSDSSNSEAGSGNSSSSSNNDENEEKVSSTNFYEDDGTK